MECSDTGIGTNAFDLAKRFEWVMRASHEKTFEDVVDF